MTKFQQNTLGGYGYIFVLLFTVGINQNICDFSHILFLLYRKTPLKLTERNTISPKLQIFWYISTVKSKKQRLIHNRQVDFAEKCSLKQVLQAGVGLQKCIFWRQYFCSRAG